MQGQRHLLCLQLSHGTFILGSAEQADVCVLTHCGRQTEEV